MQFWCTIVHKCQKFRCAAPSAPRSVKTVHNSALSALFRSRPQSVGQQCTTGHTFPPPAYIGSSQIFLEKSRLQTVTPFWKLPKICRNLAEFRKNHPLQAKISKCPKIQVHSSLSIDIGPQLNHKLAIFSVAFY